MPLPEWVKDGLPNWKPLEGHIGPLCSGWMWMYRSRGLEYYKHADTRRYLILDAEGQAWRCRADGELVEGDFDEEYRRATNGYSSEIHPMEID